jgi:signal transduction histidine kinase
MTWARVVSRLDDVGGSDQTERPPRPPLLSRVSARQLQYLDFVLAAFFAVVAVGLARGGNGNVAVPALLAAVTIALRRRAPFTALSIVIVVITLTSARINGNTIADPFVAFPMYQVASVRPRRESIPALAVALVCFVAALSVHHLAFRGSPDGSGNDSLALLIAVASWFVGDSVRTRRTYTAGLAEQAAQRQRETVERAQRSVAEERLQIARELHDVVAHSLSVIAVQSGVGRHVIDTQPAEAKKALAAVEMTSRSALDELRRMLGVLRRDDGIPAALAPAPDIGSLGPLIEQVQMAGYVVDLDVQSTAVATVAPTVGLSIYRIVQEALTNVVKHAGPARVVVEIRDEAHDLVLEVSDDGGGRSHPVIGTNGTDDGEAHHGIVGMRERVALFDGALSAGPLPDGGFRVLARFPLENLVGS